MRSMIQRLSMPAAAAVTTLRPLRSTVTVSAISSTSSMKCEMKTMLLPAAFSRRSTWNSRSISGGDSAEVGSSRMIMRAPENSTRVSSTSCCSPIGSAPIRARGSTMMPSPCRCRLASRAMPGQSTSPSRPTGWTPRKTFSATLSSGTMLSS